MNEPNLPKQVETGTSAQKPDEASVPTNETAKATSTPLTRPELITALNSEIQQIEAENKRPGWSSWALQGGIATFIWLALADFNPKSNLQTIGIVFLFGSFFAEFMLGVCQYFSGLNNLKQRQLRYRFSNHDPNLNPAILIFMLVRFSGLLLIYFLLGPAFQVSTLSWFCGISIGMCVVVLPIRIMKFLSSDKGLSNKNKLLVNFVYIAWSGFIAYQLFKKLPFSDEEYKVVDFRVGFLLVGVVYLFWLLTTGEKERPIISTLKEIRRALSFGHISTEEAAKEADIALSGLTATAVIEHKLTELSAELQNVILGYEKQIAECWIADAALKQLEEKENQQDEKWREDAQKVAILVDSCEAKSITNQQLLNTLFFKTKSSLNDITKLRTTDSSMSELVKRQDVSRKIGSMSELSKSASSLVEDIKARYKVISLENNLLET